VGARGPTEHRIHHRSMPPDKPPMSTLAQRRALGELQSTSAKPRSSWIREPNPDGTGPRQRTNGKQAAVGASARPIVQNSRARGRGVARDKGPSRRRRIGQSSGAARGSRLSRGASAQFVRVGVRSCVLAGGGSALSRSKRSGSPARGMWWEARDVGDVTTRPFAPSNSKFSLSAIHICSSSICCSRPPIDRSKCYVYQITSLTIDDKCMGQRMRCLF
jgi:hypothetical protein